jgi:hypothetical protein
VSRAPDASEAHASGKNNETHRRWSRFARTLVTVCHVFINSLSLRPLQHEVLPCNVCQITLNRNALVRAAHLVRVKPTPLAGERNEFVGNCRLRSWRPHYPPHNLSLQSVLGDATGCREVVGAGADARVPQPKTFSPPPPLLLLSESRCQGLAHERADSNTQQRLPLRSPRAESIPTQAVVELRLSSVTS